jgi:hypothetical protein
VLDLNSIISLSRGLRCNCIPDLLRFSGVAEPTPGLVLTGVFCMSFMRNYVLAVTYSLAVTHRITYQICTYLECTNVA